MRVAELETSTDVLLTNPRIKKEQKIALARLTQLALLGEELRDGLVARIDVNDLDSMIYERKGAGGDMRTWQINISTFHSPVDKISENSSPADKKIKNSSPEKFPKKFLSPQSARDYLKKYLLNLHELIEYNEFDEEAELEYLEALSFDRHGKTAK